MNIYCEFGNVKSNIKDGIFVNSKKFDTLKTTITNIDLKSEILSKKLNKSIGYYSTIFCEEYNYLTNEGFNFITSLLINEIKNVLFKTSIKTNAKYFVVGLGNADITADSLGNRVIKKIISTSLNLKNGKLSNKNFGDVFSIAPSVASKNGVYTLSLVKAIVKEMKPDVIFVVDSLSCKDINYICKTFQVNNCGLTPGCEIGNKQPKIDSSSLKVPVISIGCPVVTNLNNIIKRTKNNLVLTLKDIDIIITKLADIISFSLNKVIHNNLSDDEIIFLSNN